jgi:hypothetical protein
MADELVGVRRDCLPEYFVRAFKFVVESRPWDLVWIKGLSTSQWRGATFLQEYAWVVMVSGFRVAVVSGLWHDLREAFLGFEPKRIITFRARVHRDALLVVRHKGKVNAVMTAAQRLMELDQPIGLVIREMTGNDFLEWISDWPYMGPANRLFLARNIGFREFSKPDRHLLALARRFGYGTDVRQMCSEIGSSFGIDPAEVDIVLWRYRSEGEPSSQLERSERHHSQEAQSVPLVLSVRNRLRSNVTCSRNRVAQAAESTNNLSDTPSSRL